MKVIELLYETAKDEHRLQLIAKHLMRTVRKEVEKEKKSREQDIKRGLRPEPPRVELGFLKDLIPTKALSDQFGRLGRLKIDVNFGREAKEVEGFFDTERKSIELNYPTNAKNMMDAIESTLVHELRHALDHSLSHGWALWSSPKDKKTTQDTTHPLNKRDEIVGGGDYEYLASPHEINARFSQVQRDITNLIKSKIRNNESMDIKAFMKELYTLLHNRDLGEVYPTKDEKENALRQSGRQIAGFPSGIPSKPLDNKDYRQLLKRAIKYFDAEKERLIKKTQ